jgi:glutamine synthetase
MAVLLQAGLDGIKNKITPPAAVDRNIYVMTEDERKEAEITDLPSTLHNAIKYMRKDEIVKEALGNHIYNNFIEAKKMEWSAYRQQVSEWEREQYLEMY